ncbi:MAG: hypothetical protein AAGH71_01395 [Planctomycetota bacterium]
MSRLSKARSRYVRSAPSIIERAAQSGAEPDGLGGSEAGRLAAAAGAPIERARIEQLEPRKLLFSVSIDPSTVDPVTGLGIAEGFFSYLTPYRATEEEIDIEPNEIIEEDFNDEDVGPVPPGTFFDGSDILLTSSGNSTARIDTPGGDNANDLQLLDVALTSFGGSDSFIAFSTPSDGDDANSIPNVNEAVTFAVGGTRNGVVFGQQSDLLNGQIEVELLFDGQVLDTYTQADLALIGVVAADAAGNAFTTYTFVDRNLVQGGAFDEVRIVQRPAAPGGMEVAADFFIDDLTFSQPVGNFVDLIDSRRFGVSWSFTGPAGATASFFDLYGRPIVPTIQIGSSDPDVNFAEGDVNDDGIPEFNDGIGRINLSGFNSDSVFTMVGMEAGSFGDGDPPDDATFVEGSYFVRFYDDLSALDDFQEAGFGYIVDNDGAVVGLPEGPGALVIGSPYVRPLTNYNPAGEIDEQEAGFDFNRGDQGFFLTDGSSIGQVVTNAVLHGTSRFSGSLGLFSHSYIVGSLSVSGDLGQFYSGSDAGLWQAGEDGDFGDTNIPSLIFETGGQLAVGRTLGEFAVLGRNAMDITVDGDLSSPNTAPPDDALVYDEREVVFGIRTDLDDGTRFTIATGAILSQGGFVLPAIVTSSAIGVIPPTVALPITFGDTFYRNDSILNAEYIGSAASTVIVRGSVGGADPVNTGEDLSDVYAFAVDGSGPVTIENIGFADGAGFRVQDVDGRTVAATDASFGTSFGQVVTFVPDAPGVYYLVVHRPGNADEDAGIESDYSIVVSGVAPTTLGSYRTGLGGGSGLGDDEDAGFTAPSITVLSGSIGSIRGGVGYVNNSGDEASPLGLTNSITSEEDAAFNIVGISVSTPGDLYSFVAGGDINSSINQLSGEVILTIGRDLGAFHTGRSSVVGGGDADGILIETGGRIGLIDINDNIGGDQDDSDGGALNRTNNPFTIRTGLDPDQSGDIGLIIVGRQVVGDTLTIDTSASPGSVVGGLLVAQRVQDFGTADAFGDDFGFFDGAEGVNLILGPDSDIRFVDTPQIDLTESEDASLPLILGQTLELVDDAGGRVEIVVNQDGAFQQQVGSVIVVPSDVGEGVAIARIEVDLTGNGNPTGGRTLSITGEGGQDVNDIISIGRIVVTFSDPGAIIDISGPAQIDVWRIDAPEGLNSIENRTPNGDIVAIDTLTLDTLRVTDGDIGRTQVPEYGPRLIGPVLGLTAGLVGEVEGAIGITQGAEITAIDWNGQIYRPTTDANFGAGNAYLDDTGSPFDDALNGVIVRSGDITLVESNRSVGDVIAQDIDADIVTVRANADNTLDSDTFEGIFGSIFSARDIDLVQVGDGIIRSETGNDTPFAETGIYAQRFITRVEATLEGSVISSNIVASAVNADATAETLGIDVIDVRNGDIDGAYIGAAQLVQYYNDDNYFRDGIFAEEIRLISVSEGDIFRSEIQTTDLTDLSITGGFYDATDTSITGEVISQITADGFRNTTLEGELREFRPSAIRVGEDLEQLIVTQQGDISDTLISVLGDITSSIVTTNLIRAEIVVANTINALAVSESILASSITAGQLSAVSVSDTVQISSFSISGPIINFTVLNEVVRSEFAVTGPDGRIDLLTATNDLDADITSSGRIGTLSSLNGSISGTIATTTERGDVNQISAALDINSETDIAGDLNMIDAGRNIGDAANPSVVLVRGTLNMLDVSGGRLISDLRVGESITQTIMIGAATNLPADPKAQDGDITAFGVINGVEVTGDYDGVITSESGSIGSVLITDGSLLQAGGVIANDGSINSLTIVRGHLLGTVFGEFSIGSIRVEASADGSFGDIGINNQLSSGVGTDDPARNQLPPTAIATNAADGPIIASLGAINSIVITGGDIIEATIYAGTFIANIDVTGSIRSNDQFGVDETTVIAAGDLIQSVSASGDAEDVIFLAGVTSFGDQPIFEIANPLYADRFGGTGTEADTIKSGSINSVSIGGDATDVRFVAGLTAGSDGIYNTFDGGEGHAVGFSVIETLSIGGTQSNVTFSADRPAIDLNGTNVRNANFGATAPNADGLLAPLNDAFANGPIDLSLLGAEVPRNGSSVFTWNGTSFRVEWSAPPPADAAEAAGQGVIWDGNGTLILANTRITHDVTITILDNDADAATALPTLNDFNIRSNDEASIGTLRVTGENGTAVVAGDSSIVIDNFASAIVLENYEGTGRLVVGADVGSLQFNRIAGVDIQANFVDSTTITASAVTASFNYNGAGSFTVTQNASLRFNVDRSIQTIDIGGTAGGFVFRAGGSLGSFEANEVRRSRLSVANTIGSIDVAGDVFDTAFIAGGDLGTDAVDGDGSASSDADRVTSGTISDVDIGGNFTESDIIAGFLRGGDGFFGTADDAAAAGESSIGTVDIDGSQTGSNINSESFAILSSGTIGMAMIDGEEAASVGNLVVGPIETVPVPLQVDNFGVVQDARTYTAFFTFNQAIDEASFVDALRIREVRNETDAQQPFDTDPLALTPPTPGVAGSGDYSIVYDEEEFIFEVTFDRAITDRDLIDNMDGTFSLPDEPGPGVYRFELDANVLRGLNAAARLDGNGDGFSTLGDTFSMDDIVGDAGDVAGPRTNERVEVMGDGDNITIDFYEAVNLDLVLDSNTTPDGIAETNTPFTIRGAIADHPDRDLVLFGFGGDKDVYEITLQAGQILRLGEITGAASQIVRSVFFQPTDGSLPLLQTTSSGPLDLGGETNESLLLPGPVPELTATGTGSSILIKQTGTYYIVTEASGISFAPFVPGLVDNSVPQANQVGNYQFDIEIFDDGNSGFNAGTDSGNGTNIVDAPVVGAFGATAGQDPETIAPIIIGDFTFRLLPGADGVINPGGGTDDIVSGQNADGSIISTRAGNRLESRVVSSIGPSGAAGTPGEVFADVDVFHLNNFQPIQAGSVVTVTVELSETGTDLGSIQSQDVNEFTSLNQFQDLSDVVQFALFETTRSNDAESADLVFSPTDFTPRAGTPGEIIATDGTTTYGYDENGDFFITFVVPPSFDGGNGSFAVYLQGGFQADYAITVVRQGSGSQQIGSQNFLIEAAGGTVDWYGIEEAVSFAGFDAGTLGFSGNVNDVTVNEFILSELVTELNGFFSSAGFDVTFSINPNDFEFQEFSTIFLTSDNNSLGLLSGTDYGVSERSDPFNADKEDEAVVFAPAYATLGFNPSPQDLDNFIDSIAVGIARRAGELLGLRLTDANPVGDAGGLIDIQGEESIAFPTLDTASIYAFDGDPRELASSAANVDDTGFFLGDQDALALLDTILADD